MGVIYIGIGGTGLCVLERIKDNLSHYLNVPNPDIGFVGIDVGDYDCPTNLTSDIVSIEGGNVENTIKGAHFNSVKDWWYSKKYAPPFSYIRGAFQFRILGRLALYLHGEKIIDVLQNKIEALGGNNIDFIVVSSTSGGTGAGMFRDMPGVISMLMEGAVHNVYGLLISHDVVNQCYGLIPIAKTRSKLNAFSLLHEIDAAVVGKGKNQKFNLYGAMVRKSRMMTPYKNLFLIFLNNASGRSMDTKEDYFELSALALENLYYISSQYSQDGPSFSGVENTLGPLYATPSMQIPFMIDGTPWHSPFHVGKIYSSFATAIIEFPENEAKEYLSSRFMKEQINAALSVHVSLDTIKERVDSMVSPFLESNNQDKLVTKAHEIYRSNAKVHKKFILQHERETKIKNISDQVAEKARGGEDPSDYINSVKSDQTFLAATGMFNLLYVFLQEQKNSFIDHLNEIYSGTNFSVADKKELMNCLYDKVKLECEDFKNTEMAWLNTNKIDDIENKINTQIGEINGLIDKKAIEKLFARSNISRSKEICSRTIAEILIDYREKYYIYTAISVPVATFFVDLLNRIDKKKNEIDKQFKVLEDEAKRIEPTYPSKIECVGIGRGKIDFRVRIAHSRNILESNLIKPNLKDLVITYPEDPSKCIDEFRKRAESKSRELLRKSTLDKMLELEADYFWKEMELDVVVNDKEHVVFNGLKDAVQNSMDAEWMHLLNKYSEYFNQINLNKLRTNRTTNDDQARKELIHGRISLTLERWKDEFFSIGNPLPPPIANGPPQNYISYIINKGDDANPINEKVDKMISQFARKRNAGNITSTKGASRTRAAFVNFSLGTILMAINSFVIPSSAIKDELINSVRKYMNGIRFSDPDSSGLHFADKRCIEDTELLSHFPLIEINSSEEELVQPFKVILLLLALKKANFKGKKIELIEDLKTDRINLLSKGHILGDLNELYRLLFIYYLKDLSDLLDYLTSELVLKTDKKKLLDEGMTKLKKHPDFKDVLGESIPTILEKYQKELKK